MCGDSTALIRPNQCHTVTTGQLEASLVSRCLLRSVEEQLGLSHTQFDAVNSFPPVLRFCLKQNLLCFSFASAKKISPTRHLLSRTRLFSDSCFDPSGIPDLYQCLLRISSCVVSSSPSGPTSLGWSCDIYFSLLGSRHTATVAPENSPSGDWRFHYAHML